MTISISEIDRRADFTMKKIKTPSGKEIFKKSTPPKLGIKKVKQDGEELDQTRYDSYKDRRRAAQEQRVQEAIGGRYMYHPKTGRRKFVLDHDVPKFRQMNYTNAPAVKFKEEQEIEELDKKTLSSYVQKASVDVAKHGINIGKSNIQKNKDDSEKKALKRLSGIRKASNKLAKEDIGGEVTDNLEEQYANAERQFNKYHNDIKTDLKRISGDVNKLASLCSKDGKEIYWHKVDDMKYISQRICDLSDDVMRKIDYATSNSVSEHEMPDLDDIDEIMEEAGKRGRRKKGDTADTDKHIVMQLRKADDLKGKSKIKFRSGHHEIPHDHIKKALAIHDHPSMRPTHKRVLRVAISKSPGHLERVVTAGSKK